MRKIKQMMIISMAFIAGAILLLYFGGFFKNRQISGLPEKNKLSFIEIYGDFNEDRNKHHKIESKEDISEIYDVLLSAKRSRIIESGNDVPVNISGRLVKMVLTYSDNDYGRTLFAYQGDYGKYYIESPYQGIYKISSDKYEILTQYFMKDNNL